MAEYDKDRIEDSLEFCRTSIAYYETELKKLRGNSETEQRKKPDDLGQRQSIPVSEKEEEWLTGISAKRERTVRPTSETTGLWLLNNLLVIIICVVLAFAIALVVTRFVAHQTQVEGESMEPALADGDSIIIERIGYCFSDPKRFDVIVFPVFGVLADEENETYYVKRIIGLPGETVQIIGGKVYIDGEILEDDTYGIAEILDGGVASESILLGEDEYFVLGDNRNMSTDSRSEYVGVVHRDDIVGKAFWCIRPLSHFGRIVS